MVVQIAIPAMAVTFIAAAIFVIALFSLTDWFEILGLALAITVSIFFIMR